MLSPLQNVSLADREDSAARGMSSTLTTDQLSSFAVARHGDKFTASSGGREMHNGSMESRIHSILRAIQAAGFDDLDSLVSSYYTEVFDERSPVRTAQQASLHEGPAKILRALMIKANSLPRWEANGYQALVVRSAADIIADEFLRLKKKRFHCELDLQQHLARTAAAKYPGVSGAIPSHRLESIAAEIKQTLREEVRPLDFL